jgi:hypothetical protein
MIRALQQGHQGRIGQMMKSKLRYFGLLTLAVGGLALATVASTTPASSQGGYFGQRATQNRDYARQSQINSRMGKTNEVTMVKKKKKKAKKKKGKKSKKAA